MTRLINYMRCLPVLGIIFCFPVHAQFQEKALELNVDFKFSDLTSISGGVALFDMNNDQLLDLFISGGTENDGLFINNGTTFDRVINYLDPEDFDYYDLYVNSVAAGDLNNDGYDDLLLGTFWYDPCVVFINKKNGKFDAIPGTTTNITSLDWSAGATLGDINQDGMLDIFITNYIDTPRVSLDTAGHPYFDHVGLRNNLFINQGNNVFQDMSLSYGITLHRNTLTSSFTDYDLDGDVDLMVVNDFGEYTGPNEMYRNNYPAADVDEVAFASGADVAFYGMGIAIGDYDGDLDLDYYMTNIGKNALLQNDGTGHFTEKAYEAGVADEWSLQGRRVGWGTGFFDYDNDGDLDLYVSNGYLQAVQQIWNPLYNPNSLYRNDGGGTFTDVSEAMNFDDPRQFRGSAFGDLNNDGKLDVVLVPTNGNVPPDTGEVKKVAIYYNITENNNNWVQFKLNGTVSNRSGFGARVYLYDNSGRVQLRECDGGSSHASSNTPYIHFGIGTASAIDSAVVFWPSGLVQSFSGPPINQMHVITESDADTSVSTGLQDLVREGVRTWPNPAGAYVDVLIPRDLFPGAAIGYELLSLEGQVVRQGQIEETVLRISLEDLSSDVYLLRIFINEQGFVTRKIVLTSGR